MNWWGDMISFNSYKCINTNARSNTVVRKGKLGKCLYIVEWIIGKCYYSVGGSQSSYEE